MPPLSPARNPPTTPAGRRLQVRRDVGVLGHSSDSSSPQFTQWPARDCVVQMNRAAARKPILVYLVNQRESLWRACGSRASLAERFVLCAEEDFQLIDVPPNAEVIVFFDCENSANGTVFVGGGYFERVLPLFNAGRVSVMLVNEDPGREVRSRVVFHGARIIDRLPQGRGLQGHR